MAMQPGKGQAGVATLGSSTLQAALQQQRNLQQRVDSDLNSLVENFSNMVAACKIQDQTRNAQEAFQIDVHVAKIGLKWAFPDVSASATVEHTQAAESLLDAVSELKQSAVFGDFEARNEQVAANNAKYDEQVAADAKEIEKLRVQIEEAYIKLQKLDAAEQNGSDREMEPVRDAG